ncbi:MAG: DUF2309 domain-containing protein [Alphaproteobacteria bacterium]|nr:DUF2309 domain-containing protein [Alphaproteobacteria bacterium]
MHSSTAKAQPIFEVEPSSVNDHDNIANLRSAIERACGRIAPLWPLNHFVAVNPFLGFTDQSFASTCMTLRRVSQTRMLMPRCFYRAAITEGVINDAALNAVLNNSSWAFRTPLTIEALKDAAQQDGPSLELPRAVVATIAEILDGLSGNNRQVSLVGFMIDEISSFCGSYFDEGQASWKLPTRKARPYTAWRLMMQHDRNAEMMGIKNFRLSVLALPDDPVEAIACVIEEIGIPQQAVEDYILRALMDIGGWASYARYLKWNAELAGGNDDTMIDLLAIRMVWGLGLFRARSDQAFRQAWLQAMAKAQTLPEERDLGDHPDLVIDLLLHDAYEFAYRSKLVTKLTQPQSTISSVAHLQVRPAVQAAFCIDVRSETFRRALETAYPEAETIGFAGFFGFPIEYVPIGQSRGGAQCPVLLKPAFTVCEAVQYASQDEDTEVLGMRLLRRRADKAWKSFKLSAVSCFSFVETTGLLFAGKLATDSAGLTRPVPNPNLDGLDAEVIKRVGPRLAAHVVDGRQTGFNAQQRLSMAEAVLKAMSMTSNFARLILLAGHGSTTVNNPHASGLDCGACGGHTGEANARVAAAILNDANVRTGLKSRGITIPDDCWFLGALHDTTTDKVKIFDEAEVPESLSSDLEKLKNALTKASSLARLERSALLGLNDRSHIDEAVIARSRDWSQVRPEWGLAGNDAFIAAPRKLTQGRDLEGRAFLHSYNHTQDAGYGVLELIMTAPMVVASWINLQYYGSTVNNDVLGSGNKVLHNVVGQLGVLEGNAGDLKVGLPFQSVHDGYRFVHQPLRLNAFIAAPESTMDTVIAKHQTVRDLVLNGWVHLHSLSDDGMTIRRLVSEQNWQLV